MSNIKFQGASDGHDYMLMPNQSLYSDMVLWPAWLTCATWSLRHREEACGLPDHRPPGSGEIHNLILKSEVVLEEEGEEILGR